MFTEKSGLTLGLAFPSVQMGKFTLLCVIEPDMVCVLYLLTTPYLGRGLDFMRQLELSVPLSLHSY